MGGRVKIKAAGAGAGGRAAGGGGGGGGGHGGGITKYAQPFSGQSSCRQSLHLPVLLFMSHNVAEDLPLRCLRVAALAPLPATTTAVSKFERKNG